MCEKYEEIWGKYEGIPPEWRNIRHWIRIPIYFHICPQHISSYFPHISPYFSKSHGRLYMTGEVGIFRKFFIFPSYLFIFSPHISYRFFLYWYVSCLFSLQYSPKSRISDPLSDDVTFEKSRGTWKNFLVFFLVRSPLNPEFSNHSSPPGEGLEFFLVPRPMYRGKYSFIFLTYFFICPSYLLFFSPSYILHIFSYIDMFHVFSPASTPPLFDDVTLRKTPEGLGRIKNSDLSLYIKALWNFDMYHVFSPASSPLNPGFAIPPLLIR